MAASAATASSSFGLCPNYAVICSFLERYGALLDLPELTFPQLERYLQDTSSVPKLLVDLHVKLLRKIGKSVSADRWEKYLVKVCQEFNTTWAWELEQKGYKEMQTECKAAILKYLCECQFDENIKFKTAINEEDPDRMRIQPIGRDKDGQMYWFQLDQDDNVRVYVEEQDDLDGSSWKCIVKNRNDLAEVVALLKTQIDPELLKREQEKAAEADEKKENTEGEAKKVESSSDEDSKDDVTCSTSPKVSQKVSWNNSSVSETGHSHAEAEACSGKPAAHVGACSNEPLVKTEPLDVSDRRTNNESSAVAIKTENGEEVKTNGEVKKCSAEEIQQALKSQQQAKIPLKKRGMKFSEDFDRNSNIIVPNASLHQGDRCAKTEPAEARPSLNEHVNGDVQPEAEKELQGDPKPSELEPLEQKKPPPEEAPAAAPPSPKDSTHLCGKRPEEVTPTEGLSLSTDGPSTEIEDGFTDSRGDAEAQKEDIRELTESRDQEAAPGSTPPPPDPDTAETQKQSSQEAKTAAETVETHCREAPEKEECPEEQTPDNSDAGGGGGARAASEQEARQANDQSTPHGEGNGSVEKAGEEEEPSEPSEGTNTLRETDLKPARPEEEEPRSLSPDNTKVADNKNTQGPPLDPPAETKREEENVEKEKQNQAEDHVSEKAEETKVDKTEQQNKEEEKTEEPGEASKLGGTSPETEGGSQKEVVNGGEALPGSQATSKRPVHRRRAQVQAEDWPADAESDANVGRSLRRSPRISRPTTKTVEVHDKSSQNSSLMEKQEEEKSRKEKDEEEEEEGEEEVKATQRKPREKKVEQEGQTKSKGRKRRRVRWSNTRTHRKKRSSEDEASNPQSSNDEESEEEDDSDEDYKVERSRRRRRNRNRERRSSDSSTSSDDDLPPNDDPCKHCGLPNHPELILLCDWCDSGYHTACLRPPLMIIPDGEWFCPPCQHKQLCDKLQEQLQNLDAALKKKERAERRKERLIYVGISVENIITPSVEEEPKPEIIKEKKEVKKMKSWGRRSTRTKKSISYRFDEFDEAIEEAIEEDVKEAEGGGAGRGKDMSNITGHRGKDMSTILQAEDGKENGQLLRASAGQRRKKRRRLNDLDSDSTVDEEESEEEFCLSESSEEEFVASDNESEAESGAESNRSEGSEAQRATARIRNLPQRRHSSRKRQRPSWYSDDEEESGEEEEEEIVTEGSSEFSDGDLDMSRRRSRRSHKAQVNYRETSESEGSQAGTNHSRKTARRRRQSSDSEVSFSGDSEDESRGKRRAGSSEEDSRERRRRLALKRRRASEEDNSDSSSDSSSEEDRPIRKRVNRIDSDDEDEDAWTEKNAEKNAEKVEEESKLADSKPPSNGQAGVKSPEGQPSAPPRDLLTNMEPPKSTTLAPNGVSADGPGQDEDEDDLLGVTDLVDYVCNNEDL